MNIPIERLQTVLETLGLKAVEARLENLLEQASKKEPSYADFLDELLSCEVEARRTRYLRARLQLAHFPFVKTFEQFDFGFQPSLDDRQIRELRSLRFIHEASNVIFLGPPGVGKTHLSVALAEEAIRSGLGAYFITAHDLAADLGRAYREGRLDRRMRVYLAPPRGQEGAEAAARSLASDSVTPKARQKTALGSTPSEAKEAHS